MYDYFSAQRDYIQTIGPYLDQKYKIYSSVKPKITLFPDGTVEHDYDFTCEQLEVLGLLDDLINIAKEKFDWSKYEG